MACSKKFVYSWKEIKYQIQSLLFALEWEKIKLVYYNNVWWLDKILQRGVYGLVESIIRLSPLFSSLYMNDLNDIVMKRYY